MIIKRHSQKQREGKEQLTPQNNVVANDDVALSNDTEVREQAPEVVVSQEVTEPEIDLFDIENIDFVQRQERRRGSRRRGYRRIDDRNLVSRAQEESENIKKSAFEEGYRKGLEKASADMDIFRGQLAQFMSARKDVFEYIAPDILEISVDIAKTIIKKELESDPQVLINTIVDIFQCVGTKPENLSNRILPFGDPAGNKFAT